jgi:hypothetical protein
MCSCRHKTMTMNSYVAWHRSFVVMWKWKNDNESLHCSLSSFFLSFSSHERGRWTQACHPLQVSKQAQLTTTKSRNVYHHFFLCVVVVKEDNKRNLSSSWSFKVGASNDDEQPWCSSLFIFLFFCNCESLLSSSSLEAYACNDNK